MLFQMCTKLMYAWSYLQDESRCIHNSQVWGVRVPAKCADVSLQCKHGIGCVISAVSWCTSDNLLCPHDNGLGRDSAAYLLQVLLCALLDLLCNSCFWCDWWAILF